MNDLVARLRGSIQAARALDRSELLAEAADEIVRLRSQPCPFVTGTVTQHCTLTPLALTDAEREAVAYCAAVIDDPYYKDDAKMAATLRGLLERLGGDR